MSNARYVATVAATDPLAAIFTPAQATLWELDVTKSNRIVYKPVCTGKLEDVAKLAEELNAANSKEAKAVQTEADKENLEASVGIPTQPPYRGGADPVWLLSRIEFLLEQTDGGKMNLPQFRAFIAQLANHIREDLPK